MREEGVATDALRLKAAARLLGVHTDTPTHRHTSEKEPATKAACLLKEARQQKPSHKYFCKFNNLSLLSRSNMQASQLLQLKSVKNSQQMQTGLYYCCPGWVYASSMFTIYCTNVHYALHV